MQVRDMVGGRTRIGVVLAAVAALLVVSGGVAVAAPAGLPPTIVHVRVEGATSTIFDGLVFTNGHSVTTVAGGTHVCDGTNNGANPAPGSSATAVLDDAADLGGFTWDGTFSSTFDDYLVTRIGPDAQTATAFWGILRNGQLTDVGGCQQRVSFGDEVLFAYDVFSKAHVLHLEGPLLARVNEPAVFAVTDAKTDAPVAGVSVRGVTTGADGKATVHFDRIGIKHVKAEKLDSVRSNRQTVLVLP